MNLTAVLLLDEEMPVIHAVETVVNDPLQYLAPLPYTGRYYPYGFPVDVSTDTRAVLDAAAQSWGVYSKRFDTPPLRVHMFITEGDGSLPLSPTLRGQQNLLLWICDPHNFSVCDRLQRFAFCCVSRAVLADPVFFRWHFLEAVVYTLLEQTCMTSLHAACVAWGGVGVLLHGVSGVGKSTLSYACARRGWTYVSDDGTSIVWDAGRTAVGEPHHFRFRAEAQEIFPELRGLTVGRELDRKPTIEVMTANLPIRTTAECSVERIVFLQRDQANRAVLTHISRDDARERLLQDAAVFDPVVQDRRRRIVESVLDLPCFQLRYGNFEEAVAVLEEWVREGGQ